MSAPPFLPLYVADYLADTTHLTQAEHGAYVLLLMAMWRAGGELPNDEKKLARFSRSTPPQWARIRVTILSFFEADGDVVKQRRLVHELAKYEAVIAQKSKAGLASAAKKAVEKSQLSPTAVPTKSNQPEPDKEPDKERDLLTSFEGVRARRGDEEFAVFWKAWPEKKGKGSAEKAFAKARRIASLDNIVAGIANVTQTHAWTGGHHVHAATWLNDKRWLDEPENYDRAPPVTAGMIAAAEEKLGLRRALEELNGGRPNGDRVGDHGAGRALPAPAAFGR